MNSESLLSSNCEGHTAFPSATNKRCLTKGILLHEPQNEEYMGQLADEHES